MILCDYCDAPATRMVMFGPPSARRVICDTHRDAVSEHMAPGRWANDWLRGCSARDAVYRMRRQNLERGLLSRAKFERLEKESPGW